MNVEPIMYIIRTNCWLFFLNQNFSWVFWFGRLVNEVSVYSAYVSISYSLSESDFKRGSNWSIHFGQCSDMSSGGLMYNSDLGIEHLSFCLIVCEHRGGAEESSWIGKCQHWFINERENHKRRAEFSHIPSKWGWCRFFDHLVCFIVNYYDKSQMIDFGKHI